MVRYNLSFFYNKSYPIIKQILPFGIKKNGYFCDMILF